MHRGTGINGGMRLRALVARPLNLHQIPASVSPFLNRKVVSESMIAVVFVVTLAAMAGLKYLPGMDAVSWGNYSVVMGIAAVVSTAASFLFARFKTNQLTLNSNPHSVALILKAVNHITGNFMNQVQFIKSQLSDEGALSEGTSSQIDDAIEEAQAGLVVLNGVQDNSDEQAYANIYPQ